MDQGLSSSEPRISAVGGAGEPRGHPSRGRALPPAHPNSEPAASSGLQPQVTERRRRPAVVLAASPSPLPPRQAGLSTLWNPIRVQGLRGAKRGGVLLLVCPPSPQPDGAHGRGTSHPDRAGAGTGGSGSQVARREGPGKAAQGQRGTMEEAQTSVPPALFLKLPRASAAYSARLPAPPATVAHEEAGRVARERDGHQHPATERGLQRLRAGCAPGQARQGTGVGPRRPRRLSGSPQDSTGSHGGSRCPVVSSPSCQATRVLGGGCWGGRCGSRGREVESRAGLFPGTTLGPEQSGRVWRAQGPRPASAMQPCPLRGVWEGRALAGPGCWLRRWEVGGPQAARPHPAPRVSSVQCLVPTPRTAQLTGAGQGLDYLLCAQPLPTR